MPSSDDFIRVRSWVRGSDRDIRSGLLGYLSIFYGDLALDGLTVRRTANGRLTLSFPERRDARGRRHPYIRPNDDDARQQIERAVFGEAAVAEGVEW